MCTNTIVCFVLLHIHKIKSIAKFIRLYSPLILPCFLIGMISEPEAPSSIPVLVCLLMDAKALSSMHAPG